MTIFYYLPSCTTCKRVLAELGPERIGRLRDIKADPLTAEEVDALADRAGSYAALFSRRARKYRSQGLAERELTEANYRQYILDEYTFLKRPVLLTEAEAYVGSAKATVSAAKSALDEQ
jgi:arsenate reductase